ncbi:rRNA-processing protein bfr2 [Coemansia sp. RSA 371]|nr:rRNA-processing protein bfr2 [Coemansia sp. RSA 371]
MTMLTLPNTAACAVTPVWLDCDVGHDDAMALILAAYHPQIKLLGVSSVSGNSSIENTTRNAIRIIQAAGIEGVKVYQGAGKPLVKQVEYAANIHGASGIDGTDLLPEVDYEKYFDEDTSAVNAMYNAIMSSDEPISIVAVGPLTNIALLLSMYPKVIPKIKVLSIMGGAIGLGNTTAAAEFNIYCDPEAAHIVLNAGLEHIALVPLDVTHTVRTTDAVIARINRLLPEPNFAQLTTELLLFFSNTYSVVFDDRSGAPLHDPVAVSYLFMRSAFTETHIRVDVECSRGNGSGRTYCDFQNKTKLPANCWVTTAVDVEVFWDAMIGAELAMPPTAKKTKSLLEQIADITDPQPKDYDIENDGIADNAFIGGQSGSGSEESEDEELVRKHYVSMDKSALRRQQGIGELGPKYTGSRISRKDLYDGDDISEQSDDEEIESGSQESDSGSESEDDAVAITGEASSDADSGEDSEADSEDDSGEDSDASGYSSAIGNGKKATESRERLRAEMKKLEEGEKALLSSITQTARSDIEKGQHVLNQTHMWEGMLDARIRIQKLVTAANELPQFDMFDALVESQFADNDDNMDDSETSNHLENARQSVMLLLQSIVELQQALVEQNPAVSKASQSAQKRKASESMDEDDTDNTAVVWKELSDLRSGFKPYRDESLEKWGNKVQISANVASLKKFKAVNQGILHQINQTLAAGDRLVERTQLKRVEYKIIGKESVQPSEEGEQSKVDAHLKDTDPEIFDDTDYYQQLLRELIESRMVDSNDTNGGVGTRWAAVNHRPSKKRAVDTKASKGRRIRYHVLEKLQNFMPPVPMGTWHEDMVNELFSSLLGQKVPKSILDAELEESKPQASTVTESLMESGEIDISSHGLRLFG